MGIHGQILHGIIRKFFAGGALVENQTGAISLPPEMKTHGAVLIADLLTQLREVTLGANGSYAYAITGTQLVDSFVSYVNKAVGSGHFRAYIGVVDVQHLTPHEKLAEQRKRSKSHVINPYPKGSYFTEEGIVMMPGGGAELISTQRVFTDRVFRIQLFKFIADELTKRPWVIMKGVDFVMDFDEHAYFVIKDGVPSWKSHDRTLGEADLQMMVWAHMYSARHVIWLQSIDRDLIAIITSYVYQVQRENRKGRIQHELKGFWYSLGFQWEMNKSHPNAPKDYVFRALDMVRFTHELKERFSWNPLHFVLACILCGTDFLRKSDLVNLISVPMVFWGVCTAGKEFTKRVGTSQRPGDQGPSLSGAYFVLLLQSIYTEHYTSSPVYKGVKADDRARQYMREGTNKGWKPKVQKDASQYKPLEPAEMWATADKAYSKGQQAKARREATKAAKAAALAGPSAVAKAAKVAADAAKGQQKVTKYMPNNKSDNTSRRLRFPELAQIKETFTRVAWNMRYWLLNVRVMKSSPVYRQCGKHKRDF